MALKRTTTPSHSDTSQPLLDLGLPEKPSAPERALRQESVDLLPAKKDGSPVETTDPLADPHPRPNRFVGMPCSFDFHGKRLVGMITSQRYTGLNPRGQLPDYLVGVIGHRRVRECALLVQSSARMGAAGRPHTRICGSLFDHTHRRILAYITTMARALPFQTIRQHNWKHD